MSKCFVNHSLRWNKFSGIWKPCSNTILQFSGLHRGKEFWVTRALLQDDCCCTAMHFILQQPCFHLQSHTNLIRSSHEGDPGDSNTAVGSVISHLEFITETQEQRMGKSRREWYFPSSPPLCSIVAQSTQRSVEEHLPGMEKQCCRNGLPWGQREICPGSTFSTHRSTGDNLAL